MIRLILVLVPLVLIGLEVNRCMPVSPLWRAPVGKEGCDIKGNISINTGERIYHVPGGEWYAETRINTSQGERWFCSEEEARQAGWRRSYE